MAKLSAHGRELARRETPTKRIAVMSDGNLLVNHGQGWKLWKRVKPGVDVEQYAAKFNAKTAEIPAIVNQYIHALMDAVDLEHRAQLHNYITLMPTDPDGIWSMFEFGYEPDLDDIAKACRLYQAAEETVKRSQEVA